MSLLESFLKYFIQPLLLAAVIAVLIRYFSRVKYERKTFRIAIDRDFYEGRHFLKNALSFFFIAAIVTVLSGVSIPEKTILMYQALGIIALLFGQAVDLSLTAVLATGLITLLCCQFDVRSFLLPDSLNQHFGFAILVLTALCAGFQAALAKEKETEWFSPKVKNGKRGRKIVGYYFREMTIVPLILLLPLRDGTQSAFFWPLSGISDVHFTLFLMPLLVATNVKTFKRSFSSSLRYYRRHKALQCGMGLLFSILAAFVPKSSLALLLVMLLTELIFIVKQSAFDGKGQFWYVETSDGARVVAVKSGTPAAKMKLVPGDVILECNKVKISNADELYQALQKNSAYCHLLVKTMDGELKICESALYADAPHEIGIILFG